MYISRHFNKINDCGTTLIKSSTNKNKIISEYSYFYFLPDDKKRFFVQPFNLSIDEQSAQYEMEKINYKNIAQRAHDKKLGKEEFKDILYLIEDFKKSNYHNKDFDCKQNSQNLVIDKTFNRIKGNKYLEDIFNNLHKKYEEHIIYRDTWNKKISHGDLCFSNMFWIEEAKSLKMIDPRGAEKESDIYMDEYYDLAKLSHSIFGKYEEVIYNTNIDYTDIENIFIDFLNSLNIHIPLLKIYEASLFLSMIPLHKENNRNIDLFIEKCTQILSKVDDLG